MNTQKVDSKREETAGGVMGAIIVGVIAFNLAFGTGCIKRYRSTDTETEIEFATGIDFGFSASGTDTLNNNRGIQPGEYRSGKKQ